MAPSPSPAAATPTAQRQWIRARAGGDRGRFREGGARERELAITDPALFAPRVTLGVDVIVDAANRRQFYGIEARLREAGHEPAPDGPIGRWRIDGVPVDLTPAAGEVLGFTNRWNHLLIDTAVVREIAPALEVRMATPAMFLAAKLEAHRDRGAGDPLSQAGGK